VAVAGAGTGAVAGVIFTKCSKREKKIKTLCHCPTPSNAPAPGVSTALFLLLPLNRCRGRASRRGWCRSSGRGHFIPNS